MDRISNLKRSDVLKELKQYDLYKGLSEKRIIEKIGQNEIYHLRTELRRLSTQSQPQNVVSSQQFTVDQPQNYLSAKKVLSTILLNSDTETVLQEYIVSYLQHHPSLVTQYLNQHGLYHVYFRLQDPNTKKERHPLDDDDQVILLKSFATQKEAEVWILEHGKDIVADQEDNYAKPVVITIIYDTNEGLFYPGENPAHFNMISTHTYPTFAFSKKGYKMLIKEYDNNVSSGNIKKRKSLDWIHYVKSL